MLTKKCKQCGTELLIEMFYKHKDCKDGVVGVCKECYRKNRKQYREENKEYLRKKDKQKYQRGRNSILKRVNKYRKTHKEQVIIAHKEWYEKNKERYRLNGKLYVEQNREKVRQYKKQYAEQNKDKIRERERHRYLENKEKRINDSRIWKKANPEKVSVSSQKRRALQKELPSTLNAEQWTAAKECFNNKCAYCGKETGLTQDHFIPLSKSGEYSASNIIPACINCNSKKHDLDFFEWYPRQEFYSKKREQKILKYLNYDPKTKYQQIAI
jgi:5-methylcytosine-specific restriction endonuclease McrA